MNSQIQSIKLRVATIEENLTITNRSVCSIPCLFFFFFLVKQDPGADLGTTVLDIAKTMDVIVQKEQVLSVNHFRLPNATENIQTSMPVASVLVKFVTKDMPYTNFKAKAKLAKSGVFVTEYLTKMRKLILEGARDRYGVRNVWTDHGRIYKREQGDIVFQS